MSNPPLPSLFSLSGKVSRKVFVGAGVVLFAIKYNIDRLIALSYGKSWYITDYFKQPDNLSLDLLGRNDQTFYTDLVIISLPFILLGTVLCLKRLRDIQLPLWLVGLFFIPFINLIFFGLLCILPGKNAEVRDEVKPHFLGRIIPRSSLGSILFSLAVTESLALLFTILSVNFLQEYGWGLFLGIPFFTGFCAVLLYAYHHQPLTLRKTIAIALTASAVYAASLLVLAFEGIICMMMAAPFAFAITLFGAVLGWAVQDLHPRATLNSLAVMVFWVPVMMVVEKEDKTHAPVYELKTSIVINQPPQKVWEHLIDFSRIAPPEELIFKTGIAYPVDAKISGTGTGATRYCNFTTGSFVEPITTWNEPNLLQFDVLQQPPPMAEMSFYEHVNAPHLEGYFQSQRGQFKLTPLPGNKTLLEGTTWYRNEIFPLSYWKLWSDYILHKIHYRVLKHIKQEAERDEISK